MRYAEQRRTVERCDAPHGAAILHIGQRWLCGAATCHVRAAAMRSGDLPCGGGSYAERRPAAAATTTTTTTIIIIIILARFRDLA